MELLKISAEKRTVAGRKTNALRATRTVPAIFYGFEVQPSTVQVDQNALERIYKMAGESTVFKLELGGKEYDVLLQDVQRDVMTGFPIHADFRRIDMTKKVEAKVHIHLVGLAPAVKELGGTLLQNLDEVSVLALPSALVREIQVDVSGLKSFEDMIRLEDLVLPEGVELRDDANLSVAAVKPPRSDAELAALEGAVDADVSKIEITTEKKVEEGAAPAAEKAKEKK